jgi:predicted TPR repeat methyltransferase
MTQPQHLSIDEAMQAAMGLHRAGHHEDAYKLYVRVLDAAPSHPDALHYLGVLAHDRGCDEDAIRLMSFSVALVPDHAGFRNNLGNLLLDNERFEEAEFQYHHALALEPDRPDALHNYAVLCKALGRNEEAEAALRRAIELAPGFTDARNTLAGLYFCLGRFDESFEQAREALDHAPKEARTHEMRGYIYCKLGRFDEAANVYREWLADDPGNPKALHHLAACTGEGVPERAADAYVQYVFDSFSKSFDSKLAMLGYRAPALVAEAVTEHLGAAGTGMTILDAGCGTGLCAALLKPLAGRLIGIDLSDGMLEKARTRGLYDELHRAELTAYMQQQDTRYDVVVSADTLVYFGALAGAMHAAACALRPGGCLCFTVEALADGDAADYRLQHHGRYAHARPYLEAMLGQAGFRILRLDREVLRSEDGEPVAGWLVAAQKARG